MAEPKGQRHLGRIFAAVLVIELVANLDAGILPGTLIHVKNHFDMSYGQLGVLGCLVYIGLTISCPLSGMAFMRYSPKRIIVASMILNALAVLLFGIAPNRVVLFIARIMIGFTQGPIFIYAPVWVDEFSPEGSQTKWMSLLQAHVALGIMFGYVIGGVLTTNFGPQHFRTAFVIQALLLLPFGVAAMFIDPANMDACPDDGSDEVSLLTVDDTGEDELAVVSHSGEQARPASGTGVDEPESVAAARAARARRRGRKSSFLRMARKGSVWAGASVVVPGAAHRKSVVSGLLAAPGRRRTRGRLDSIFTSYAAPAKRPRASTAPELDAAAHLRAQLEAFKAKLDADKAARAAQGIPEAESDSDSDAGSSANGTRSSAGGSVGKPEDRRLPLAEGGEDAKSSSDGPVSGAVPKPPSLPNVLDDDAKASDSATAAEATLGAVAAAAPDGADGEDGGGANEPTIAELAGLSEEEMPTTCSQLKELLSFKIFVWITLALSALYFVVTGIQFWVTDYMVTFLHADPNAVVAAFALASLTGPTAGVFFGGWVVDKRGGYKDETGHSTVIALECCVIFGMCALAAAIVTVAVRSFIGAIIALWLVLFCGGCLLPPATGITISAVPQHMRSFSSAWSMMAYNLLGYAAAPFLCGLLAEWTSLAWGFRVVMGFSGVAMVCMVIGWRVAKAEYEAHQKEAGNAAPVKALEMVPPEVSGLAAVEAGAAGAGAGAGAGSSSVGGASGASSRRPTRRLSGSTTSTFASDLPYEMARTRGWTITAIDGLFAGKEDEKLLSLAEVNKAIASIGTSDPLQGQRGRSGKTILPPLPPTARARFSTE